MQSVQSALLSVQAQAKLAQESNPKPGAEANLSFHDRERVNYNNDPKNTKLMTAQENGRIVATGFLESCRTLKRISIMRNGFGYTKRSMIWTLRKLKQIL